jgi:hypothetical protein
MILVWDDAKSFNRHLESIKAFRRSRRANIRGDWNRLKDMPVLQGVPPKNNAGGVNRQFNACNGSVTVPIPEITLMDNSQN